MKLVMGTFATVGLLLLIGAGGMMAWELFGDGPGIIAIVFTILIGAWALFVAVAVWAMYERFF